MSSDYFSIGVLFVSFVLFCLSATNHHSQAELERIMKAHNYKSFTFAKKQSFFNFIHCDSSRQKATKVILHGRAAMVCSGHFFGGAVISSI